VEALQRALGKGDQANRKIQARQPGRRLHQMRQVLEIGHDVLALANSAHGGNQADGGIGLDHEAPPMESGTSCASTSEMTASASPRISSSVRSWMGCGTKTRAGSKPSALDCAAAADANSAEATNTPGNPSASSSVMSCTLHDVQLPQSASASI